MNFVILLSMIGAVLCAPDNYGYQNYPTTTKPLPPPPAVQPMQYPVPEPAPYPTPKPALYQTPEPAPAAPAYTKTYFHPISSPIVPPVKFYSANPVPLVTGSLYNFLDTHGQYKFSYSLSDGQSKSESKQADGGVSGQYSYIDPEGKRIELSYVADKDGFRAAGDHLPVAPQVPELPAELAAAYNEAYQRLYKAHEEARLRGITTYDDGSYKPVPVQFVPSYVPYHTYVASPVQYATYQTNTYTSAPAVNPVAAPKPEYSSSTYNANIGGATYKVVEAPVAAAPAPKPVYSSNTYNANIGGATYKVVEAPVAPVAAVPVATAPAPAPKPVYSSSTYNTNVGGAPVPLAPATPALPVPTKSGYIGNPY